MDLIPIKKSKMKKNNKEVEVYIVPAISIQISGGTAKKIPHPQGFDNLVFKSLDSAVEAINLAGFGYVFEDKQVPPSEIPTSITPDLRRAVDPLLEMLKDDNPGAVASAAYALGELRSTEAIKPLLEILGQDDMAIRKNATEALAKIGDPAIRGLIEALSDKNWVVRNSAATALGEMINFASIKIVAAVQPLTRALEDSNWIVKSSAATSIGKISAFLRDNYQQQ